MRTIRIAARVASYMYSDGIPYDGSPMHKDLLEIYNKHTSGHKIDLSKMNVVGETDPTNPDTQRR